MILIVFVGVSSFVGGLLINRHRCRKLNDQLDWLEMRDKIGDHIGLRAAEDEIRTLYQQLAGLIASPRAYVRARRLVGPLELEPQELATELQLMQVSTS